MKETGYCQCTLEAPDEGYGGVVHMVEWVPKRLAFDGNIVRCKDQNWQIIQVGAYEENPRSSHECKT